MSDKKVGKTVSNGPIGRVVRTLGYFLIGISVLFLLFDILPLLNIELFEPIVNDLETYFVSNFGSEFLRLKYQMLIIGIIFLIFTLSKNYFLITLTTLLLLVTTLNINLTGALIFNNFKEVLFTAPVWMEPLTTLFNDVINNNNTVTIVLNLLAPFMVYVLIASKKPNRWSTKIVSSGMLLLTVAALFYSLPYISDVQFLYTATFESIINYNVVSALVTILVGSVFGIIGLFRK